MHRDKRQQHRCNDVCVSSRFRRCAMRWPSRWAPPPPPPPRIRVMCHVCVCAVNCVQIDPICRYPLADGRTSHDFFVSRRQRLRRAPTPRALPVQAWVTINRLALPRVARASECDSRGALCTSLQCWVSRLSLSIHFLQRTRPSCEPDTMPNGRRQRHTHNRITGHTVAQNPVC